MADHAIFVGWGEALPGQELKAVQVFGEVVDYYRNLQQQGEIEGFEAFALEPHGGDLSGFLIVRGEAEKLGRLRGSPEFQKLSTRGRMVVQSFGVVGAVTGAEMQSLFQMFAEQAQDLTG